MSGLFIGRGVVATDVHVGYVAGRYRSGVWSDQWTDVSRCAERTFTDYAPACVCGWRGRAHAATLGGQRRSLTGHSAGSTHAGNLLERTRPTLRWEERALTYLRLVYPADAGSATAEA